MGDEECSVPDASRPAASRRPASRPEAVVIGAGPGGLAAAAMLQPAGVAHRRRRPRRRPSAASWRGHYDRLHLHTVRWLSHLPGYRIPRRYRQVGGPRRRRALPRGLRRPPPARRAARHRGRRASTATVTAGCCAARDGDIEASYVVVATGHNHTAGAARLARSRRRSPASCCTRAATATRRRTPGSRSSSSAPGNTGAEIAVDLVESGAREVRDRDPHAAAHRAAGGATASRPSPWACCSGTCRRGCSTPSRRRCARPTSATCPPTACRRRRTGSTSASAATTRSRSSTSGSSTRSRRVRSIVTPAVEGFDGDRTSARRRRPSPPDAVIAATGYRRGLDPLVGHLGVLGTGRPADACAVRAPTRPHPACGSPASPTRSAACSASSASTPGASPARSSATAPPGAAGVAAARRAARHRAPPRPRKGARPAHDRRRQRGVTPAGAAGRDDSTGRRRRRQVRARRQARPRQPTATRPPATATRAATSTSSSSVPGWPASPPRAGSQHAGKTVRRPRGPRPGRWPHPQPRPRQRPPRRHGRHLDRPDPGPRSPRWPSACGVHAFDQPDDGLAGLLRRHEAARPTTTRTPVIGTAPPDPTILADIAAIVALIDTDGAPRCRSTDRGTRRTPPSGTGRPSTPGCASTRQPEDPQGRLGRVRGDARRRGARGLAALRGRLRRDGHRRVDVRDVRAAHRHARRRAGAAVRRGRAGRSRSGWPAALGHGDGACCPRRSAASSSTAHGVTVHADGYDGARQARRRRDPADARRRASTTTRCCRRTATR